MTRFSNEPETVDATELRRRLRVALDVCDAMGENREPFTAQRLLRPCRTPIPLIDEDDDDENGDARG